MWKIWKETEINRKFGNTNSGEKNAKRKNPVGLEQSLDWWTQ